MRINASEIFLFFLLLQSLAAAYSFSLQMSSSTTVARATSSSLNKKSTALDVLKTLNNSKRLSPYVSSGSGTAVITGASKGIGAVCAETLALTGMNVVLCVRNVEEGEKVRDSMPSWVHKNVQVRKIDLADLSSVKEAADDIINISGGKIDILVNNAGVMAPLERMETKQGMEIQFGTNHVAHHYLTRLLLPCFADNGRVVTVASEAHRTASIDFEDINSKNKYSPWGAYGQSKLANVLFAKSLQDELVRNGRDDILSLSLHPGVIATNLWQYTPSIVRPFASLFSDKTVEQGAATSVFAALVSKDDFDGGEYLSDCAVAKPSPNGKDEKGSARSRLWDTTEYMIKEAGFTMPKELV
uniref:Protochlorophyllide reductase n=1 Tax=Helicotheca tamesis TaxID=374047 RepID=A0A7S2MJX3_9STRA